MRGSTWRTCRRSASGCGPTPNMNGAAVCAARVHGDRGDVSVVCADEEDGRATSLVEPATGTAAGDAAQRSGWPERCGGPAPVGAERPQAAPRPQPGHGAGICLRQFISSIDLIPLVATIISPVLGDWLDTAIRVIILGSAMLSFAREYRANSAAEKLRPKSEVRYAGRNDTDAARWYACTFNAIRCDTFVPHGDRWRQPINKVELTIVSWLTVEG